MSASNHGNTQTSFPLRCDCTYANQRFTLASIRKAMQVMQPGDGVKIESTRQGLTLLAETELALEPALATIRRWFGDQANIGPLTVQPVDGQAPWMGVRLQCDARHYEWLRADLMRRGALLQEQDRHTAFLRASAPLCKLLGYPAHVRKIAADAQLSMWLSHYEPLDTPPPAA